MAMKIENQRRTTNLCETVLVKFFRLVLALALIRNSKKTLHFIPSDKGYEETNQRGEFPQPCRIYPLWSEHDVSDNPGLVRVQRGNH
jgi:hypothetical protein